MPRVIVRLTDGRVIEPVLTGDPVWREESPGGCATADIPCLVDDRSRLIDAGVEIHDGSEPWVGLVSAYGDDGVLKCVGHQSVLSRFVGAALYCDDDLSGWKECVATVGRSRYISPSVDDESLVFTLRDSTIVANKWHGMWRYIPTTNAAYVTFDYTRPSTAWRIQVYSGVGADTTTGFPGSTLATMSSISGTSGSATATISHTGATSLRFFVQPNSDTTPDDGDKIVISNIKVYGVEGVTSCTPTNVLNSILDQLPTWALPAGSSYRQFVASDSTSIAPFAFPDESTTHAQKLSELLSVADYEFGFRARLIGGKPVAVPVFEPRVSAPSYMAHVDGLRVTADFDDYELETCYTNVRVIYKRKDGSNRYVDVASTSLTNPLVASGRTRWGAINVDTTDTSIAQFVGTQFLNDAGRWQAQGSATITGDIQSITGASVSPADVHAGRIVRLFGTQFGTVDAFITAAEHSPHSVTLTLNNSSGRFERLMARYERTGKFDSAYSAWKVGRR